MQTRAFAAYVIAEVVVHVFGLWQEATGERVSFRLGNENAEKEQDEGEGRN